MTVSMASLRRREVYTAYMASLTALAIVLKFFEIPFPLATFLKYDIAGVPLALMALLSLRAALASLPVFYIVPTLLGFDAIGMGMKVLAEVSTFTPMAVLYRRLGGRAYVVWGSVSATISRTLVMCLANLLVTPYWILFAGWRQTYEEALGLTIAFLPYIAVFNATLALIVFSLTIGVERVLRRSLPGLW